MDKMDPKQKRTTNVSKMQKDALMGFLEENPKLLSGKLEVSFTHKDASLLWENCAKMLNAIPGSYKDWKGWRKVSETQSKKMRYGKSFG